MEPCAPGTEDDTPIMYSTLNKQANEKERLLKLKAILRNGHYGNVFELSYVNGAEHWFCNSCQCPVMGRVYQHEIGKRHTQNMALTNQHITDKQQKEEVPEEPITIDIAPGEPVPPGFEEEIGRVSQIQERLDGFNVGPLIALEYLLELQDYDPTKEPYYLCILCDKRGDPRTVLTHLASYNHISQYLQKHFPTCYRALAPYMTKQYKRNWQTTLQKIAEAIEKKFGRLKPYPIEKDKFERERLQYLQMISMGKHFSENTGFTFEELIVHDELTKTYDDEKPIDATHNSNWGTAYIQKPFKKRSPSPPVVACPSKRTRGNAQTNPKKPIPPPAKATDRKASPGQGRRRSLSSVSSISSNDLSDTEAGNKNRNPARNPKIQRGRQMPYQRKPSPKRRSPPRRGDNMPWQNTSYQRQKNDFSEKKITDKEREKLRKIEEFRKLARAIENDMHKTLKQHENNPEKHPQYNDEWKKFWNKRYKELQGQGVDASKHNFKPEWIEFWNKRMVELHSDELRSRKDALRKRLGLPEEPNPIKFKIGIPPPSVNPTAKPTSATESKPNLPMAALPDIDNEVIVIDDMEDDKPGRRSRSPWEDSRAKVRKGRSPSPARLRRRSRSKEAERKRSPKIERAPLRAERPVRRSKSRSRERPTVRRSKSRSRERPLRRSRSRDRSLDYKDRRSDSRDKLSHSRERSWEVREKIEKRMDRDYRESSYERDLRGRERVRTVADLPWERQKVYRHQFEDYYKPPHMMRDVTRKPVLLPEPGMPMLLPPEEDDDGEVNIVDVLRILTALEERLGSLGPKVIDLLAQALALEKKEANSSETLLDNDLHCVVFETVKEKLKGQLLAGLVDMMQERAFKKAIKKTATLLHMAGQRKRQRERMMPKPVTVPGVGAVDKAAIAKQIATALIMQGKTDVTQAELEQLINTVVGMAEASRNSDKPMTTANFLQQLAAGNLNMSTIEKQKEVEPPEKIIIPTSCKVNIVELEKLTEPLTPSPGKSPVSSMENLSDSDLQTLLQNFKDLSTDEQHNLINYLKKLENHEPERVERLRKFVNLDPNSKAEDAEEAKESKSKTANGRESPFSNRMSSVNPTMDDSKKNDSDDEDARDDKYKAKTDENDKVVAKVHLDSEDEDYSYEDVVKSVSKTVKDKELEDNMKLVEESMKFETTKAKNELDLSDAKALISNLMSNFSKSSSNSNTIDLLGLGTSKAPSMNTASILTSTADFAKTFSNINIANLASIVSNAKKITPDLVEKGLNFEPPSPIRSNSSKLNFDPSQLNKSPSPETMDRNDPVGFTGARDHMGPGRGFDEPRFERMGPGVPGMGPGRGPSASNTLMGSAPRSLAGGMGYGNQSLDRDRGHIGPGRDFGPGRDLGPARDMGIGRDFGLGHDLGPGRDLPQGRDMGPVGVNMRPNMDFGPRDRSFTQYPRNVGPYGSSYGNNNYPPQANVQYPNVRPNRPFEPMGRAENNPRFGGSSSNQFRGGNYNRW